MVNYSVYGKTINGGETIEIVKQPGVATQTIGFSSVPTLGVGQAVKLVWRALVGGHVVLREEVLASYGGVYRYAVTNEMEDMIGAAISAQLLVSFGGSQWRSAPFAIAVLPEVHITTLAEVVDEVQSARGASASLSVQLTALLAAKANKAATPTAGNIATVDANGHVTDGGTALAAITAALTALKEPPIVAVAESKTLALTDAATVQKVAGEAAVTLTIPLNASVAFPVGTEIVVLAYAETDAILAATEGVTLNSASGNKKINGQYATATLKKMGADEWVLYGSLKA